MYVHLIGISVSAETDVYPSLRFQGRKKKQCHGRLDLKKYTPPQSLQGYNKDK